MKKFFSLAAAALLIGGLASASAFAADAPAKTAPKKAVKSHHAMSCSDYAYESQAMKDCMAKADMKKGGMKSMKTSTAKKNATAAKKAM
jgi:hypothetical protein